MKNKIYIDIDSERDQPILFGKGEDVPRPKNEEEAKEMVLTDITCLGEALISLIHIADHMKYATKEVIVNQAIASLNRYLKLPTNEGNDGNDNG